MGNKLNIKTYINTIRYYLKTEETEESSILALADNPNDTETFVSPFTDMQFALIPAGEFEMGSPLEEKDRSDSESPIHKVKINNSFYLGKSAVTQKQWKKIMGNNPSYCKGEDHPVEMISWNEAQEFVIKLNEMEGTDKYRLPSEAEWEYACRAGTQTRCFFGEDESKLDEYVWHAGNSGDKTHVIGCKKPNPWGLYDINGNVWEWVQDNWYDNYNGAPSDGSAWEDGSSSDRVSRGCSWLCETGLCRSAGRFKRKTESRLANLGFRLLKEL
ncbi:SUMF1/EgtB/PvdO family nonheme iron enzyme [Methanosarcina sp. DH1]|nr:formylglycine-generating enzyme family protein [Methanosarcina sp. DH1]MCC4768093.1 SUMF1/EgtB/PvdO family nonheme iron enzyme [Methanosarcina sp. DH1]